MMRNPLALALKLACLALAAFVVLGIVRLAKADDPAGDLASARAASLDAARDFIPTGGDTVETDDAATSEEDAAAEGTATEDTASDETAGGEAAKDGDTEAAEAKPEPKKNDDKPKAADTPESLSHIFAKFLFDKKPPKKEKPIVLEGIGGDSAFITAPNGRSGLVAVGETFQGIKVLKIAQNRVLIEYKGETRELNIWSGLGSEPLIDPKASAKKTPTPKASPGGKK